ncbi:uncharacterized protein LOC117581587 [Drosophila guanche]|uniref:Uncharacterized protein n=1 Tax=Drosophila guanche TaxID=7266 RepID=A0A3B0J966_DROGU|nr:uncharacterized protein LOC117581587 [Drosophila guanche]SPP78445.1 Hypothetical predicted protein [Drosophila guanche]
MNDKRKEQMPEAGPDNATLIFTNNANGVWKKESGVMSPPLRQLMFYLGHSLRVELIGDLSAFGFLVRVDFAANLMLQHCAVYRGLDEGMSIVKPRDLGYTEFKGTDIISVFLCPKNCPY